MAPARSPPTRKVRNADQEAAGRRLRALPVCVAKTQYSFSTDPQLRGAPTAHHGQHPRSRLAAGAEFIVMICGDIMTMPGLPKVPSAAKIDLDETARSSACSGRRPLVQPHQRSKNSREEAPMKIAVMGAGGVGGTSRKRCAISSRRARRPALAANWCTSQAACFGRSSLRLNALSGLTALTRQTLGVIRSDPDMRAVLQATFREGIALAGKSGVAIPADYRLSVRASVHRMLRRLRSPHAPCGPSRTTWG